MTTKSWIDSLDASCVRIYGGGGIRKYVAPNDRGLVLVKCVDLWEGPGHIAHVGYAKNGQKVAAAVAKVRNRGWLDVVVQSNRAMILRDPVIHLARTLNFLDRRGVKLAESVEV